MRLLNSCIFTFLIVVTLNAGEAAPAKPSLTIDASKYIDRSKGHCGIQDAIDEAARQSGRTIVLPEGTFVLNRYLEMRSHCTLKGQGEKTILTLGKASGYARVTAADRKKMPETVTAEGDLSTLKPGTEVTIYAYGRNTHPVHRVHTRVKSIDGNRVTFEASAGRCKPDRGAFFDWGLVTRLAAPAKPGETSIRLANPELLGPQQGLYLSGKGDVWNHHFNAVVKVEGDTVTLERPLTVTAEAGSDVTLLHPAITGDHDPKTGDRLRNVTICDIVIDGRADKLNLPGASFRQAGIHFNRTDNLVIRNVTVRNWYTDGISAQGQNNLLVENCQAIGNHGRGLHPGTGVNVGLFKDCLSTKNWGDGLFYCFGNNKVVVRDCKLVENRGDGVGGLGYGAPSDRNNTVENCLIERNGKSGVECAGGGGVNNVVRNCMIRDNSQGEPGALPGILIYAMKKGAEKVTIENNTIESTLETPTQWVGIEERHTVRKPKRKKGRKQEDLPPAQVVKLANNNLFKNNRFNGHKTADIIVRGPDTVVEGEAKVIEERTGLGPVTK